MLDAPVEERDGEEDRQPGRHVKRREEGHVLRRMLDAPVEERDGEEDRQPGGHVKRREEGHVLRRMLDAPVRGKRRRGRQTTRWTCQEKGRRACDKKNVICTSTRKETERKTDSQVDMSREGKKGT